MYEQLLHVVIGGEAGQGLVTTGELLARSFVKSEMLNRIMMAYA